MSDSVTPVALLWTGGWDSTFRLLQLLQQRRQVQPVYLHDPERRSTAIELETMARIRERLQRDPSMAPERLLSVRAERVAELRPDADLTAAFQEIRRTRFIGLQYEWLARYCRQHGVHGIELCIHRDDKAHRVLEPFVCPASRDGETVMAFDEGHAGTPEHTVFGHFVFPVFHLSKQDMGAQARAQGWSDILGLTWFCHDPRGQRPCGVCNPCMYTIEEGLGWRLPLRSRLAYVQRRALVAGTRLAHRLAGAVGLDWR